MKKKNFDVTKLVLVKTFAEQFIKKDGKVGVSRQYIESLLERKKNKGFESVLIDGVKFISILDPKVIGKPSKEVEKVVSKPPKSKEDKQKANELLKNDDFREELIKISQQKATKESLGKKTDTSDNQLTMF